MLILKVTLALLVWFAQNGARWISIGLVIAAAIWGHPNAEATITPVDLGSASNFAVLAGSAITVAAPVNSTTINGDIGTFPTPTITGLGNVVLTGVNHAGDGITQQAKTDLLAAYNNAAGRSPTTIYAPIFDLGGLTLSSGVYNDPSSFMISRPLTLDAGGDPNAVWIFQAGSTLDLASGSQVVLINGAQAGNVFWQVGSSATLGTSSKFVGDILASQSITLKTGATVEGRVLALDAAVTMDNNYIYLPVPDNNTLAVPEPNTALLAGFGLATMFVFRRRALLNCWSKSPSKSG